MTGNRFKEFMLKGIFEDSGNSPFKDSIFAMKILDIYLKQPKTIGKSVLGINLNAPDESIINNLKEEYEKITADKPREDHRILKFMMHGIRGVRKMNDNSYYGLDCMDSDGKPCSLIVIGSNGIGKTSFYSALEMLGMGYSNCAKLRNYESREEMVTFMKNVYSDNQDGRIMSLSQNGTISSFKFDSYVQEGFPDHIATESCFCSDYDIQKLEAYSYNSSEKSFSRYIHEQLNLEGFGVVLEILNSYNDDLSTRVSTIRSDSTSILNLKNDVFGLLVKRAVLDHLYKNTEEIKEFFPEETDDVMVRTEEKIVNDRINEIPECDITHLRMKYSHELDFLYSICYIPKEECYEYYQEVADDILQDSFYFQSEDDIKTPDISYLYHNCINVLNMHNEESFNSILSSKKDWFSQLKRFRDAITDTVWNIPPEKVEKFRFEIECELRKKYEELYQFRMSLIGKTNVNMKDFRRLSDECNTLIEALKRQLLSYDLEVYKILKDFIPALCSKSFQRESGEEVIVGYGPLANSLQTEMPTSFESLQPFELYINVRLKDNDTTGHVVVKKEEPGRYLNTFRHKLFCFALKLALACCSMKLDHRSYPIVVDDVFDASDFKNRNEISLVIKELTEQYNKIQEIPDNLQLILFSQDEIVAERVFLGLTLASNKVKLVRLMHSDDYENEDGSILHKDLKPLKLIEWSGYTIRHPISYKSYPDSSDVEVTVFHNVSDSIKNNFPR